MVNGTFNFLLNAGDLGVERFDPFFQLLDRKGIEILLEQQGERVARAPGKEFVQIHGWKVDLFGG